MQLKQSTWLEVEKYLKQNDAIILPTGSIEQHGPIGLIGTDAICAERVAIAAGEKISALVAPTISFGPAPFNMSFPGTISVSLELYSQLLTEIVEGLAGQGFGRFYFLNGHGANLEPIRELGVRFPELNFRIKSWWEFEEADRLRKQFYGDWEGMHATPSEVAITQYEGRIIKSALADEPPEKLSAQYIRDHSGDRHGPADEHRAMFPDGRVGSHSALANPEQGRQIFEAARDGLIADFRQFAALG